MRYLCLAVILALAIFAGTCHAQDANAPEEQVQVIKAKKYKEVPVDRNGDTTIDGIDVYGTDGNVVKRGYDEDQDGNIDRWEVYDDETGIPDVTESDTDFRAY